MGAAGTGDRVALVHDALGPAGRARRVQHDGGRDTAGTLPVGAETRDTPPRFPRRRRARTAPSRTTRSRRLRRSPRRRGRCASPTPARRSRRGSTRARRGVRCQLTGTSCAPSRATARLVSNHSHEFASMTATRHRRRCRDRSAGARAGSRRHRAPRRCRCGRRRRSPDGRVGSRRGPRPGRTRRPGGPAASPDVERREAPAGLERGLELLAVLPVIGRSAPPLAGRQ